MMIDLDRILYPEPVAAGMNPYVLMSLAYMYRGSNEHTTPVVLRAEGDYWRITDGRHRFTASVMAGRKQILAEAEA